MIGTVRPRWLLLRFVCERCGQMERIAAGADWRKAMHEDGLGHLAGPPTHPL